MSNTCLFTRRLARVVFVLAALCVSLRPGFAQYSQQGQKSGPQFSQAENGGFSLAFSTDGSTLVVGAPGASRDSGANGDIGGAWVYQRTGRSWNKVASLVGVGGVGLTRQGTSVAVSADGSTAIIGGSMDNGGVGAAWIFVRSEAGWMQQGPKLVGSGAIGPSQQGIAVSLSADGNRALIGGPAEIGAPGSAWIFDRNGGSWTQRDRLVGVDTLGQSKLGSSVALSGTGLTALVGGMDDDNGRGAVWVFVPTSDGWLQQGPKLVGTGALGASHQGQAVALSTDGNTAAVGAPGDNSSLGATWVFTRSGRGWRQQGNKLVRSDAGPEAWQGKSVSLSQDGNLLLVGAPGRDGQGPGSAAMFGRQDVASAWSERGAPLVGLDAFGPAGQGWSVSIAGDGRWLSIGGPHDTREQGAVWMFADVLTATHDFDGNWKSDITWRHLDGTLAMWLMDGARIVASASFGAVAPEWQLVSQHDFSADRKHDWLWRHSTTGELAVWFWDGLSPLAQLSMGAVNLEWKIAGTADANADGRTDILWRNSTTGDAALWLLNGTSVVSSVAWSGIAPGWQIAAFADFDGDGKGDILWRDGQGRLAIWFLDGTLVLSTASVGSAGNWEVAAASDFNGDGRADILWRDTSGNVAIWLMNGASVLSVAGYGIPAGWSVSESGDFNGDGRSDILWRLTATGDTAIWFMQGTSVTSTAIVGNVPIAWAIQNMNAN